mgnify:CR=1 FL=1
MPCQPSQRGRRERLNVPRDYWSIEQSCDVQADYSPTQSNLLSGLPTPARTQLPHSINDAFLSILMYSRERPTSIHATALSLRRNTTLPVSEMCERLPCPPNNGFRPAPSRGFLVCVVSENYILDLLTNLIAFSLEREPNCH